MTSYKMVLDNYTHRDYSRVSEKSNPLHLKVFVGTRLYNTTVVKYN